MKNASKDDRPIVPPTGTIPPIQTSDSLETAVMLSAFVIAIMVGLYVLITLAWGWLTVAFYLALPELVGGSGMIFKALMYSLAAGLVLVLIFLVKTLIPLRRKQAPPIELTQADQPELFAYIRALATSIDAPMPDRVLVDAHANASASFAGGMSPTSGPLTLTLGLPLIGGMSVRQLAGVIAHELGHFSQGSMVKQNIIIGFVSGWLTEVALGEDRFDRVINGLANNGPPIVRQLFKLVRMVMTAIRRVFYVVMIVGHLVTRMAARQLEYDADQFMAHTTGSAHFADTMRETIVIGHASMQALEDTHRFYRDRRLPNDLPAMVVTRARRMDDKQRKKLWRGEDQGQAEAFSTHPLTGKRIDAARKLNSKGLVHEDRPAHGLFRDFEKLCQQASEALYKEVIGKEYDPKHLTDSSRLIAELEATDKARKAAGRFCQSDLLLMLPMFPSYRGLKMPESPQQALDEVRGLRERAQGMRAKAIPLVRKYEEAQEKLMQSRQAHVATQAGFEIRDYAELGLEAGSAAGLSRSVSDQTAQIDSFENEIRGYNSDLIKRMELDFMLLKHAKVTERLGQGRADNIWLEIDALVPAGQALTNVQDSVENLRVHANVLAMSLNLIMQGAINAGVVNKLKQTAKDTVGEITNILRILISEQYPFSHGEGRVTIAQAICEKPPDEDNFADIYYVAEDVIGRITELRERIIGRLCHHAERVEKVMGMPRLLGPDAPDALDDLLEKIGVSDNAHAKEESHSTKGMIGTLLTQGVMGVTVLFLSGWGVYALLPSEPISIADGSESVQAAQDDKPFRGARPTRPDKAVSTDRPMVSTRPTDRPDRASSVPYKPVLLSVEDAIQLITKWDYSSQHRGMEALLDDTVLLTDAQKALVSASAVKIVTNGRSPHVQSALDLLERHTPDQGLSVIGKAIEQRLVYANPLLIEHLGKIDERQAADLLIRLAISSNTQAASKWLEREPMSKYAEDALVELLQQQDRLGGSRRQASKLFASIATEKSMDFLIELADDRDLGVKGYAEDAINRLDPRRNDAAARFLRSAESGDRQSIRALTALANSKPAEDDDRRTAVCQAVLKWVDQSNRRLDRTTLRVLANWGDASAVPAYLKLLEDERAIRTNLKMAMQLAGQQADEKQAGQVANAIGNWYLLETDAVTDSLIAMGVHGEAPAIQHLGSKHAKVRRGCIEVLLEVGTSKGLKALQSRGNDPDREVRDIARSAFYELRDKLKKEDE